MVIRTQIHRSLDYTLTSKLNARFDRYCSFPFLERDKALERPYYKAPLMQALIQSEWPVMPNIYAPVSIPDEPLVYNASNAMP
jgi:hypothetical protein